MNSQRTPMISVLRTAASSAASSGHTTEAEGIYRRVLALIEKAYGANGVEYAEGLVDLAEASILAQQWSSAESLLRQSIAIFREVLSPGDARLAVALRNMADVCRELGNELDAKRFDQECSKVLSERLVK